MAVRSTQEALLVSGAYSLGRVRSTQEALLISVTNPPVSTTYPLTPPAAGMGPQTVKLRAVSVVGETDSPFTGNQQMQQWQGQWFEAEISMPPMLRASSLSQRSSNKRYTAEEWVAFLVALQGKFGTFLLGDPNATAPQGVATGAPVTTGTSASGQNVITTDGWTPGVTGILLAGDYIQLTTSGNPQRLYKNLFDVNSDSGGNATLTVFPNVREALGAGVSILTANTAGTFRLKENQTEWDIDRARTYGISFKAKEAI